MNVGISCHSIAVALGNGDGTFQTATKYTVGLPSRLIAADFNGDGKVDLVTASGNAVVFFSGNGDGTFGAATQSIVNTFFLTLLALETSINATRVSMEPDSDTDFEIGLSIKRHHKPSVFPQ